jgi:hypothetical protein
VWSPCVRYYRQLEKCSYSHYHRKVARCLTGQYNRQVGGVYSTSKIDKKGGVYEHVSKSFWTELITKYILTFGITHCWQNSLDLQNSDTTAPSGRELYHLQFSFQVASLETFGYTLVCGPLYRQLNRHLLRQYYRQLMRCLNGQYYRQLGVV